MRFRGRYGSPPGVGDVGWPLLGEPRFTWLTPPIWSASITATPLCGIPRRTEPFLGVLNVGDGMNESLRDALEGRNGQRVERRSVRIPVVA